MRTDKYDLIIILCKLPKMHIELYWKIVLGSGTKYRLYQKYVYTMLTYVMTL